MSKRNKGLSLLQEQFHGPNLGYVMELYEKYLEDPQSVDEEMRQYFHEWGSREKPKTSLLGMKENLSNEWYQKVKAVLKLADKTRDYGHLAADIYPLHDHIPEISHLDPAHYGLSKADLEAIPAEILCPDVPETTQNGYEAFDYLKQVYTGKLAFEFHHVSNIEEKKWLQQKVEKGSLLSTLKKENKINLFKRLTEVEEFERFLHRTYVGQKRFSIEGLDAMIPLLDELITGSVMGGATTINMGMAHRGRLNVLAHILGKPYEIIFAEFQHAPNKKLVPSEGSIGINFGWTGDVKYHLGLERQMKKESTQNVHLNLANNPSHLEFVGAIVEGFTRAAQDNRDEAGYPKENPALALSIIIHGDAAFPGQGIVAETLNLGNLKGYRTGGSIHIIANNMIGFTTESSDSRSTRYASDLAKGFEVPIVHVNADDPESCIEAAILACEYREMFHKDFLIDLIGYRRFGHNEMDEPMTTNPLMYRIIHQHPTVKEIYGNKLLEEGILTEELKQSIETGVGTKLQKAYEQVTDKKQEAMIKNPPEKIEKGFGKVKTAVPLEQLQQINQELLAWPESVQVFNKLEKILQRRRNALEGDGKVDWGLAETLAFATILSDGTPIRITGQDSERGTFAQRNLVLHDSSTGKGFSPLHVLSTAKASFAIHNSPLSEGSVLGFEYGYNVFAPETLVLWEAQYGDFANSAQVIFDQFIAAGRAKWGQKSGLVMLLPHGYEGQGPEHSSGRLERFLLLAAENNWTVANLTNAAQYFHILRRQAMILNREEVRPLVIMTPKSLLRNPLVASNGLELSEGEFQSVIEQPDLLEKIEKVQRIVFSTGKVAIDLAEKLNTESETDWLHLVRIEEIYPFPESEIERIIKRYPHVKEIVWVQEEPKNMGAWHFVEPFLRTYSSSNTIVSYLGRRRRSSPAEGDPNVHKKDQARIITAALTKGGY
ncbi:2-oxoglutarate dehydrogenase E1 component [Bacillus sp. V3B]|uniref:2-oxoglutarate dehydrogenase E1 component n=1 Tax=Bacillus sp. V3B TaxID=2804915 RepID=UPI002109DA6C|nr:2-oxoglutarate dehydrogenase E1 component [Bacillus sp. V3B]MCQ6276187.1 2-oxoglutarate dehydrogenase E1 component [Bacillus sp. V3B]